MAVDNIARGMAASALKNQGGGGSSLPIVNTAAIGQTIRVSAVDDAGKPTEWEAVDMASGSGAGGFRKIIDYTNTEQIFTPTIPYAIFTEDLDGNPLNVKNLYFKLTGKITGGRSYRIKINSTDAFVEPYHSLQSDIFAVSHGFISFCGGCYTAFYNGDNNAVAKYYTADGESIVKITLFGPNFNSVHLEPGARFEVWEMTPNV